MEIAFFVLRFKICIGGVVGENEDGFLRFINLTLFDVVGWLNIVLLIFKVDKINKLLEA